MLDKTFERNAALKPISRDHGVLLVLVQRLRKAASETVQDRIALEREIRSKFARLVVDYLKDETSSLASLEFSPMVRKEIESDHANITKEVNNFGKLAKSSLTSDRFVALADLIENHVRWDERIVFPYLQQEASQSDLVHLADRTSKLERSHARPIKALHHSISLDKHAGKAQTCTCADSTPSVQQ